MPSLRPSPIWRLQTSTLLMLLLVRAGAEVLPKYHCGVGTVSKVLSYASSGFCGRDKLNDCCFLHDRCYDLQYDRGDEVLKACDDAFEQCIENAYGEQSWICTKYLKFTHSGAIKIFGGIYRNLVGYNPLDEAAYQRDKRSLRAQRHQ